MFFLLILSAYLKLWHEMSRIKWNSSRKNFEIDCNDLSLRDMSLLNRIIVFSLKKKNGEYQYIYFAKKVILLISILFIPWFACVYFYEWYNIKSFVLVHLVALIIIGSAPTNIFQVIATIYEKKMLNK